MADPSTKTSATFNEDVLTTTPSDLGLWSKEVLPIVSGSKPSESHSNISSRYISGSGSANRVHKGKTRVEGSYTIALPQHSVLNSIFKDFFGKNSKEETKTSVNFTLKDELDTSGLAILQPIDYSTNSSSNHHHYGKAYSYFRGMRVKTLTFSADNGTQPVLLDVNFFGNREDYINSEGYLEPHERDLTSVSTPFPSKQSEINALFHGNYGVYQNVLSLEEFPSWNTELIIKNSNNDEIKLPFSNLSVVLDKNIQFTDTMNGSRLYDDVFFSGNRVVSGSFDLSFIGETFWGGDSGEPNGSINSNNSTYIMREMFDLSGFTLTINFRTVDGSKSFKVEMPNIQFTAGRTLNSLRHGQTILPVSFQAFPSETSSTINNNTEVSIQQQRDLYLTFENEPTVFTSSAVKYVTTDYVSRDSTGVSLDKHIIAYQDDTNSSYQYGKLVVSTVSGSSVSISSPYVFSSSNVSYVSTVYDDSQKRVIVAYSDGSNGKMFSFQLDSNGQMVNQTPTVTFCNSNVSHISTIYMSLDQRVAIFYLKSSNSTGQSIVLNYSNGNYTIGSEVQFDSYSSIDAIPTYISSMYSTATRDVLISYSDQNWFGIGKVIIGRLSANQIQFYPTTNQVFSSRSVSSIAMGYNTQNDNFLIVYNAHYNSQYAFARIIKTGSQSITSISEEYMLFSGEMKYPSVSYDSRIGVFVVNYRDESDSDKGKSRLVWTNNNTLELDNMVTFEQGKASRFKPINASSYDVASNKTLIAYSDDSDSDKGKIALGGIR